MSNIDQYTSVTYFIEIIAISLVSLALIAVIAAIFFRQWSGKAEHQKIISLRSAMQYEKNKIDITISEIIDIERVAHDNLAITKNQIKTVTEQQKEISAKNKEIELRAEHVALLENEVQQTARILSERIDSIEKKWDEKLEHTVKTVDQLSLILESNLKQVKNQNIVANNLTQSLTNQYDELQLEKKQSAIHASIEATLKASAQLNTQLEDLQQKAENAFMQFSHKLEKFDKKTTKKQNLIKPPIVFDDIDAIALSIEEHSEYPPIKETVPPQRGDRNRHQHLGIIATENLTEPSPLKDHPYKNFFSTNKKKVNE